MTQKTAPEMPAEQWCGGKAYNYHWILRVGCAKHLVQSYCSYRQQQYKEIRTWRPKSQQNHYRWFVARCRKYWNRVHITSLILQFDDVGVVPGLLSLLLAVQRSHIQLRKQSGRQPGNEAISTPLVFDHSQYKYIGGRPARFGHVCDIRCTEGTYVGGWCPIKDLHMKVLSSDVCSMAGAFTEQH